MKHKGEIIEKAIRQSGYPIAQIARKLGKSRRWLYYIFESNNVSLDVFIEVGNIIHYDFSEDVKELKKIKQSEDSPFKKNTGEIDLWKNKYYQLLEKYHHLLTKNQTTPVKKKNKK